MKNMQDQKEEWQVHWVWLNDAPSQSQTVLQFRRTFEWNAETEARLLISANNIYRVFINGVQIGRGPDRADPRRLFYDVYDVARYLNNGVNVICCLVHHITPPEGMRTWCLYNGAPGLLVQLESDAGTTLVSDQQWRVRPAPGWLDCTIPINRFREYRHEMDLAFFAELQAPLMPDYDDTGWPVAAVMPFAPEGRLPRPIPREIPLLQPEPREPVSVGITQPQPDAVSGFRELCGRPEIAGMQVMPVDEGVWLTLDFGRPMGGFPVLHLESEGRGILDLYCGEGDTRFLTDRLRLAPVGPVCYEPLDWRGGRTLTLHFHDLTAPVKVAGVQFVEMVYPFDDRGAFQSADDTLTDIWRVCRTSARAGVKDHPVDCLNREQALWLADLTVHNRALAACFGDVRPCLKAMRQALAVMSDDGIVPVPGPVGLGYRFDGPALNWSEMPLSIPMVLADIYRFTGDPVPATDALPYLKKLLTHFQRYEDERGILSTCPAGLPELKCFGGWNPMLKTGVTCAFNFEYVMALRAGTELALAAGDVQQAAVWDSRAQRTIISARQAFWDQERCLFADGEQEGRRVAQFSPTANAWAALGGGLEPRYAGAWAEALRTAPDIMPSQTPFDATLLLEAYLRFDLDLHARNLLDNYWGAIVRAGHPTLPEFWHTGRIGGLQFRATSSSLCHPFGAGPAFLLHEHILGARMMEPGWRRTVIRPRTMGLSWARGRIPVPAGELEVAWVKNDSSWELELKLPEGMLADIILPRLSWGRERLLVDQREVWRTDGRQEYKDQLERQYTSEGPREVRTTIANSGRHTIVLESF